MTTRVTRLLAANPDVRVVLDDVGFDPGELEKRLVDQRDAILEAAAAEIRAFDAREADLTATRALAAQEARTFAPSRAKRIAAWSLGAYGVVLVASVAFGIWNGWETIGARLRTVEPWLFLAAEVVLPIGLFVLVSRLVDRRDRALRITVQEANAELYAQRGIGAGQQQVAASAAVVEKLLHERLALEINTAINERKTPSYAPVLSVERARGFGEVFDRRFTIVTPARTQLEYLLDSMPGGSIGIAGSRGAGKSTLLRLFCGPKRVVTTLGDRKVLGVLVSAPVAYQARDFILYLFSALCQSVLTAEGGSFVAPRQLVAEETPTIASDVPGMLRLVAAGIVRIGLVVAAFGLFVLALLLAVEWSTAASTRAASAAVTQGSTPAVASVGAGVATPEAATFDAFRRTFARLKIEPAPVIGWGLAFVALGLLLGSALGVPTWRMLNLATVRSPFRELIEVRADTLLDAQRAREALHPLQRQAREWLETIKFQQSFTSGWSGALKLPVGLEGGINRAVTLAQNQLSLPEIVYFFTEFVVTLSAQYRVLIGIDEMDKLASDELAQQFLNDIKSIFGIERCFYLVTVSEDAMNNFERRGLPFRDVFDSAFDDFVQVDHLDFGSARRLLEQRVIGRPVAFFALAFCMSGGLARDLVRSFRKILEARRRGADERFAHLGSVCAFVVETDLRGKLRALAFAARKIGARPDVERFRDELHAIAETLTSPAALLTAAAGMAPEPTAAASAHASGARRGARAARRRSGVHGKEADPAADPAADLHALRRELGLYLYFAATILETFTDAVTEELLERPPVGGGVDALADARRLMSGNPAAARLTIDRFRTAHGLSTLDASASSGAAAVAPSSADPVAPIGRTAS